MKKIILIISLFIFHSVTCFSQLPNTDIWLLDIKTTRDSIILINPINITNRVGYDNQPSFSRDGKYILYTSMRDNKQTDIYKYELTTKLISQFTNTATSEYSPTIMPDGENISVVMVEPDSTQRLWEFPIKGGEPSLIMKDVDSVGYYCWIDKETLAACIITNPMTLIVFNVPLQKKMMKTYNVGRTLQIAKKEISISIGRSSSVSKIKKNILLFYSKENTIYSAPVFNNIKFHYQSETSKELANEDFAFLNSNNIIIGNGSALFKNQVENKKSGWNKIADLSSYGITNITRIAVSPDGKKMAIVGEPKN